MASCREKRNSPGELSPNRQLFLVRVYIMLYSFEDALPPWSWLDDDGEKPQYYDPVSYTRHYTVLLYFDNDNDRLIPGRMVMMNKSGSGWNLLIVQSSNGWKLIDTSSLLRHLPIVIGVASSLGLCSAGTLYTFVSKL